MRDLWIGVASMLTLSAGAFVLTRRFVRGSADSERRRGIVLGAAAALFLLLHALVLLDHIALARLLPFSNLIVVGNLSPIGAAVLAACAWTLMPGRIGRHIAFVGPLVFLCLWRAYEPLFPQSPGRLRNVWDGVVCRQTTFATCSPSAAATLLRAAGIETGEREMVELCLTGSTGTSMHGVYRGLKLKTAGTEWDVEPVTGDAEHLRRLGGPVLINVGIPRGAQVDPRYTKLWGWPPGLRHTVVLFGFDGDKPIIADPSVGLERWDPDGLRTLFRGQGLRLVRRGGGSKS